ncbi:MAG TPA: dodecin, partial [Acetobacteraceae bacterium]|nr:dodecin [Acetobacteraceae bacterium]
GDRMVAANFFCANGLTETRSRAAPARPATPKRRLGYTGHVAARPTATKTRRDARGPLCPREVPIMTEPVYKIVELVGTSDQSISKAIDRAIEKASATVRHLGWFEVAQIRGSIDQGKVRQYQVTVKAGFTLEDK